MAGRASDVIVTATRAARTACVFMSDSPFPILSRSIDRNIASSRPLVCDRPHNDAVYSRWTGNILRSLVRRSIIGRRRRGQIVSPAVKLTSPAEARTLLYMRQGTDNRTNSTGWISELCRPGALPLDSDG